MSQIKLSSNPSGTGIFTLESPATNTNRTLTLPDNTGTILTTASTIAGTGPAFGAYGANNQGLTSATWTKLTMDTEEFDTASCYDPTTNYRFTPNVAGYYQINASMRSTDSSSVTLTIIQIYKNGSGFKIGNQITSAGQVMVSTIMYLNGTTDYVEAYGYIAASTVTANGGQGGRYFNGSLVRAA